MQCSSASVSPSLCVFITVEPTTHCLSLSPSPTSSATGVEDHSFVPSVHCSSFLLSASPPPGVSQAVKGLDFSAPVFPSLILHYFPLPGIVLILLLLLFSN